MLVFAAMAACGNIDVVVLVPVKAPIHACLVTFSIWKVPFFIFRVGIKDLVVFSATLIAAEVGRPSLPFPFHTKLSSNVVEISGRNGKLTVVLGSELVGSREEPSICEMSFPCLEMQVERRTTIFLHCWPLRSRER